MKRLVYILVLPFILICSCNKGGEVGPIVERAMNGIISGDYNAFVEACDLGEDSLPEDQVASAKQMTVSMLEKTMKQIKEGSNENAKKNLLKSVKVLEEKVDGDNATVKLECTTEGGETKMSDVTLKKNKNGEWKITNSNDMMPSAPDNDDDDVANNDDYYEEVAGDDDNGDHEYSSDDKYYGNSLPTGSTPYEALYGKNSKYGTSLITVTAPASCDILAIIKNSKGKVVKHAYINEGDTYSFNVGVGEFQPFFVYGMNWSPEKESPNGLMGYFLDEIEVSKDDPQYIGDYEELTYVLQLRQDGNFHTKESDEAEAF